MSKKCILPIGGNNDVHGICALNRLHDGISCFNVDELVQIAQSYNHIKGKEVIKFDKNLDMLHPTKYKQYLIEALTFVLGKKQYEWINKSGANLQKNDIFLPEGPGGTVWLNTININDFLEQLEKKYPDFISLGAVPIDFWDINYDGIQTKLDLDRLLETGKTKIGIVYNLDKHNQSGSHWVASFIDLNKGDIFYFDSYGLRPNKRIRRFLRKIQRFFKRKGIDVHSEYNATRNQFKNSECGVYSINFIFMMLKGISFDKIEKTIIPDDVMNKCRQAYFTITSK